MNINFLRLELGYPNWSLQILEIETVSKLRSLFGICYCGGYGGNNWEFDILFFNFKI
jgi:hypothetical protein